LLRPRSGARARLAILTLVRRPALSKLRASRSCPQRQ
jgi:hypothetical protein